MTRLFALGISAGSLFVAWLAGSACMYAAIGVALLIPELCRLFGVVGRVLNPAIGKDS